MKNIEVNTSISLRDLFENSIENIENIYNKVPLDVKKELLKELNEIALNSKYLKEMKE